VNHKNITLCDVSIPAIPDEPCMVLDGSLEGFRVSDSTQVIFENRIEKETLNVKEAASFLGVSTKTVYSYVNDGLLPHRRVGSRILFLRSKLVGFLEGE